MNARRARRWWVRLAVATFLGLVGILGSGMVGYRALQPVMRVPSVSMLGVTPIAGFDRSWLAGVARMRCGQAKRLDISGGPKELTLLVETVPSLDPEEIRGASQSYGTIDWLEVGWPLPCFVAVHGTYPPNAHVAGGKTLRGLDLDSTDAPEWLRPASGVSGWGYTILPTSVQWGPFSLNLAAWTAAAFSILNIPAIWRTQRRAMRRRAGHCTECGYDIHGVPLCPECGAAWRRGRIERVRPFASNESMKSPGRLVAKRESTGSWTITDDRGGSFRLLPPNLRVLRDEVASEAHRAAVERVRKRVRRNGLWIRALVTISVVAIAVWFLVNAATSAVPVGGGIFGALIFISFAIAATFGNFAYSPRRFRRDLLEERLCPSCGEQLGRVPPSHDGCTVCPVCRAAWVSWTSDEQEKGPRPDERGPA